MKKFEILGPRNRLVGLVKRIHMGYILFVISILCHIFRLLCCLWVLDACLSKQDFFSSHSVLGSPAMIERSLASSRLSGGNNWESIFVNGLRDAENLLILKMRPALLFLPLDYGVVYQIIYLATLIAYQTITGCSVVILSFQEASG